MNPIKTLQLEGDLYGGQFTKALCPEYLDPSVGNWQICISDLCCLFKNLSPIDDIQQISTNLVSGYDFNTTGNTVKTNPVLEKFLLVPSKTKVLINFSPKNWFFVNNPNDLLKLYVKSWKPSKLKSEQCRVQITVLMSRIN